MKEDKDIKILEELIEIGLEDFTDITITNRQAQAIQNLIERYKELEKENKELRKPKYIIDCKTNKITKLTNDFVSKDKVQEILSICRDGDLYGFKQAYESIRDDLQELLEES